MALVRCVTEMGMGVDVHGLDYTAAAKRAVFDAIHHSSLGFPRLVGKTADDMRVDVTIGVPKPEAVDRQAVLETLPHGGGHVNVVHGGLQVLNENGDDGWLIANTIIVVGKGDPPSYAACVVLATTRLDVNRVVRKRLGVRKASFASGEETKELTGMLIGGVTAFGLPDGLPVWVDSQVMDRPEVVLGGGSRSLKLRVAPAELLRLPTVEVVEGLAQ